MRHDLASRGCRRAAARRAVTTSRACILHPSELNSTRVPGRVTVCRLSFTSMRAIGGDFRRADTEELSGPEKATRAKAARRQLAQFGFALVLLAAVLVQLIWSEAQGVATSARVAAGGNASASVRPRATLGQVCTVCKVECPRKERLPSAGGDMFCCGALLTAACAGGASVRRGVRPAHT